MRRFLLAIVLAAAAIGVGAGALLYRGRASFGPQWAGYRIGQAGDFSQAKREIAAIEQQPSSEEALRHLVSNWRAGNQTFDYYLAAYLGDPQCGEALRRAFSRELAWRPVLLADWAHYWSWRSKLPPGEEVASIANYLKALSSADPPRRLTWRETLDLQAAFALTGRADLAHRLSGDNWAARYREWRAGEPDFANIRRPAQPLPDWHGD